MDKETIAQLAQDGREKILEYCEGGRASIDTVQKMVALEDDETYEDQKEVLQEALAAATTLAVNFRHLANVLGTIYLIGESKR